MARSRRPRAARCSPRRRSRPAGRGPTAGRRTEDARPPIRPPTPAPAASRSRPAAAAGSRPAASRRGPRRRRRRHSATDPATTGTRPGSVSKSRARCDAEEAAHRPRLEPRCPHRERPADAALEDGGHDRAAPGDEDLLDDRGRRPAPGSTRRSAPPAPDHRDRARSARRRRAPPRKGRTSRVQPAVMPHATWPLKPVGNAGPPTNEAPAISHPGVRRCARYHGGGIAGPRCGSLARIGAPDAVRGPAMAQAFEPPDAPTRSRSRDRSSASRASGSPASAAGRRHDRLPRGVGRLDGRQRLGAIGVEDREPRQVAVPAAAERERLEAVECQHVLDGPCARLGPEQHELVRPRRARRARR